MVFIKGRSGSGKSTLLNLISLIDTPSSGTVLYNGRNLHELNQGEKDEFLQNNIGIIFQNYHLLENETVLFNVMLPLLVRDKYAPDSLGEDALKKVNIPEDLFTHKVMDLSGGEKQRVAIARALVKDPSFLVCDEPTGAVDQTNGLSIMDILKEESKYKLVIVVSHNPELIDQYADIIITLENGKMVDDISLNDITKEKRKKTFYEDGKRQNFITHLSMSNFKRRRKQTIFNMVVMSICLLFSTLIFGFLANIDTLIYDQSALALDYGALTLATTETEYIEGTSLSLVRSSRPSGEILTTFTRAYPHYVVDYNLDYFISGGTYSLNDDSLYEISLQPIYSFEGDYIDHSLALSGFIPVEDKLNEVVVNEKAYELLCDAFGMDLFENQFRYSLSKTISYYDETRDELATDQYDISINFRVAAVVSDFNFLTTPKIYYSYLALSDYLFDYPMDNLSQYLNTEISFYDYQTLVGDSDVSTSYSCRLFLRDYHDISLVSSDIESLPDNLSVTSLTQTRVDAFVALLDAVELGLIFFLVIVVIVTLILLGIICLSSYLADSKQLAILFSLGVSRRKSIKMYINENLLTTLISVVVTFLLALFFQMILNRLLLSWTGISGFINIPFVSFLGVPLLFPVLIILVSAFLVVLACIIPIYFSGRISIKEELQNSD
ncbi:MAG: ATP-binding cassette domain-containing protein [Coprobacillus sp.]|nr:ATP-binding cassette domain-containing protein [Coprobacillus sp.]